MTVIQNTHLFSSSFRLSFGYDANTSHVRLPEAFRSGFNGGNVDSIIGVYSRWWGRVVCSEASYCTISLWEIHVPE